MMPMNVLLMFLLSVCEISGQKIWKQNSYNDFVKGTFDDGGANMYVSHNGRIQAINRWDVNNDGNVDILCVNTHSLVEKLDLSIYWGNGKDFSILNHSYIPANGPMWITANDVDNDGTIDLVVPSLSKRYLDEHGLFCVLRRIRQDLCEEERRMGILPFQETGIIEKHFRTKGSSW